MSTSQSCAQLSGAWTSHQKRKGVSLGGSLKLPDRPLSFPESELHSEAHSGGPRVGEDPEWLILGVRCGCCLF